MNNMTDKDIMGVILSQHKLGASALTTLVLESANQQLRNDATNILTKNFQYQKQLFDIMSQKGWYSTQNASPQEISSAQSSLSMQ